jgi:hypothetical protein
MSIRNDKLDAMQAPTGELAQEPGPESLGLRRANIHARHLPATIIVHAHGDSHGDGDDPAEYPRFCARTFTEVASIYRFGQSLSIGRSRKAFTRSSISSQSRETWLQADRALGHPAHAERLDEIIDGARRDPLDAGLLDHGSEGFLRHPPRLQE